jgi:hypothetical protein
MAPGPGGYLTYLLPLAFVALAVVRNARERNLRVERLWIAPVLILAGGVAAFTHDQPPNGLMIGVDAAAVAVGALIGWWRGRLTHISVDPATHVLTSKASPVGMLLILAIFALRYVLRVWAMQNAGALHVSVSGLTDAFLLLAVGIVCAQRLEMAIRASRLLTSARNGASPS